MSKHKFYLPDECYQFESEAFFKETELLSSSYSNLECNLNEPFYTPGMVDLQVNGFGGIDFNSDQITADQIDIAMEQMLHTGTCYCLPTIITDHFDDLECKLRALDEAVQNSRLGSKMVLGFHLEGPFISGEDGYRGCHPQNGVQLPSIETYNLLTNKLKTPIKMVTLAAEVTGAFELIDYLRMNSIVVSIGHSNIDRVTLDKAIKHGARYATHLNNGLAPLLDKNENTLFSLLSEDRIHAGIIADGIHILPHIMKIILRVKGINRLFLVTDATAGASAAPGEYQLGSVKIRRDLNGMIKMIDEDRLAGSSATMASMLNNMYQWFSLTVEELTVLGCSNAREVLRLSRIPQEGEVLNLVKWQIEDGVLRHLETTFGYDKF